MCTICGCGAPVNIQRKHEKHNIVMDLNNVKCACDSILDYIVEHVLQVES